jgi:hypothetical protein
LSNTTVAILVCGKDARQNKITGVQDPVFLWKRHRCRTERRGQPRCQLCRKARNCSAIQLLLFPKIVPARVSFINPNPKTVSLSTRYPKRGGMEGWTADVTP